MSTKILNGFRFRSSDLFEIHAIISQWRIILAERHRSDLAALMADMCTDVIDRNAIKPAKFAGKVPYSEVRSEIRTRQKEILGSGSRDPEVDFDFEISVLPHDGAVYGMVFSERQSWIDLWMAQDGVEEYGYWNHVDRPDGVSAAEWKSRAETWNGILRANPAGTPGMAGFTAQCADRFNRPEAEQIMTSMPTFEARVARQAKSAAVERVYVRMEEEKVDMSNPLSVLMKIDRWLAGDGAHVLDEERARVETVLSREVSRSMVFDPLPDAA